MSSGYLYISEVSDNKSGFDDSTGFIELWNNTGLLLSLDGYSIQRGSNPSGAGLLRMDIHTQFQEDTLFLMADILLLEMVRI